MQLTQIITLANRPVERMFHAMERSLRATGCNLPIQVIPYNDQLFDLPPNAHWWLDPDFIQWIDRAGRRPVMRKYQTLLASNFLFVDTDVIFLLNPEEVLAPHNGFITCCGHWHNPGETLTDEALAFYRQHTTVWQSRVFNTGQFASDQPLYTVDTLRAAAENPAHRATILDNPFHEQPGINLLTFLSGIPVTNLTLPPHNMQSTWAGDYPADFAHFWKQPNKRPLLIHWAGAKMDPTTPITQLFLQHLNPDEKNAFLREFHNKPATKTSNRLRRSLRAFRKAWNS